MTYSLEQVNAVYDGKNGDATKAMYAALIALGPRGEIVCNLFRCQKNSELAKGYKSGRSTGAAYQTKGWAMDNLTRLLGVYADEFGIEWGWAVDDKKKDGPHADVLYVMTPFGQCSFHSEYRGHGPNWPHDWDGLPRASRIRICAWAARLFNPDMVPRQMSEAPRDGTIITVSIMGYSGVPAKGHYAFERVKWMGDGFCCANDTPTSRTHYGDGKSNFYGWWPDGTPEDQMEKWPQTNFRWVPSNGTGGMMFQEAWCDRCIRERPIRENYDHAVANGLGCDILLRSMAFDIAHPQYPNEWTENAKGEEVCTAFERDVGQGKDSPIPERCPDTPDLFGGN